MITVIYIFLQDGSVVHFKIKRNTQLKKLMQAYCDRQGFQMNTIRFMFDGNPIGPETTPSEVSFLLDMHTQYYYNKLY